jgi:hypothetical protein
MGAPNTHRNSTYCTLPRQSEIVSPKQCVRGSRRTRFPLDVLVKEKGSFSSHEVSRPWRHDARGEQWFKRRTMDSARPVSFPRLRSAANEGAGKQLCIAHCTHRPRARLSNITIGFHSRRPSTRSRSRDAFGWFLSSEQEPRRLVV